MARTMCVPPAHCVCAHSGALLMSTCCQGQWLGRVAAVLTISHMDCAGMQESQCTRDSVDCGKVLGTL